MGTVAAELWIEDPEQQIWKNTSAISVHMPRAFEDKTTKSLLWKMCSGKQHLESLKCGKTYKKSVRQHPIFVAFHCTDVHQSDTPPFRDRGTGRTQGGKKMQATWLENTSTASEFFSSMNTSILVFCVCNLILSMYQTDQMSQTYVRHSVSRH